MSVTRRPARSVFVRRALAVAAGLGLSGAVVAGTFPSGNLAFQTSGQQRPTNVGDWYTTTVDDTGGGNSNSTDRIHRFLVEITAAQLAAAGGSLTIQVLDAESFIGSGPCDEVDGFDCDPAITAPGTGTEDPTQFRLFNSLGAPLGMAQNFTGTANGGTANFSVTAAGIYQLTSVTGATPVSGNNTTNLNDDDNGFLISVPFSGGGNGGGLASFQGSFQQDTGTTIPANLYFVVGPSVTGLVLRNFDLDCGGGTISYTRPNGTSLTGTASGNAEWNGGAAGSCDNGSINAGADNVAANNTTSAGGGDAGVWRYNISALTTRNQSIFEANDNTGRRLPAFDTPPQRAGLFTMTPSDVLQTQIGTPVDHGFTVTNQYFTTDIVNFTLSGTSTNWTTQLLRDLNCDGDANDAGDVALTDTDGDGRPDTGILQPGINGNLTAPTGNSACYVLRTTPQAGANSSDTTRVSGVSFMDNKVVPSDNTTLFVDKTTLIPPRIDKAFNANPIQSGGVSRLTFTLTNVNTRTLTAVNFTDVFPTTPGQMRVATPPNASTSNCGAPTWAPVANAVSVAFSGGTLAAGGTCTVQVDVTAPATGNYNNTSTAISATTPTTAGPTTLAGNTASATLNVLALAPPSIAKSFSANPIPLNGTSVLTLTISNPNTSTALTGVSVLDTFPTNLVIAGTPALGGTCAGAPFSGTVDENDAFDANNTINGNDRSLRLTNATLAASSSCTITVNVTSATAGTYNNVTDAVTSANGGTGNTANASLTVHAPPTVAKSFTPATINNGSPSVLAITLSNPNSTALSGAAFTDNYLAGMTNTATPNGSTSCGGGTVTAAANGTSVALAGGTIPANGSCVVTVNVTRAAAGSTNNTIAAGGLTTNGGVNNTVASNTATLTSTAIAPPTITKTFLTDPIQNGGSSVLRLVIGNPNATTTLTGVAVTDTYPTTPAGSAMANANPANPGITCTAGSSGNFTGGTNGGGTIGLASGEILAGGNCTITVSVTKATAGTGTNTTGAVSSTNGGTGGTASDTLQSVAGLQPPVIAKAFSVASTGSGNTSQVTLTFTITNPNAAQLTGIVFTDTFPDPAGADTAQMVVATPLTITNTCGGNYTDAAGGALAANDVGVRLNNVTLAAGASCTASVNVFGALTGAVATATYANATNNIDSNETGAGGIATADLVVSRPTIVKSFSPDPIAGGAVSKLTITLSNPTATDFTISTPGFTDTFPTTPAAPGPMTVAATPNAATSCAGSTLQDSAGGALAAGDAGIRLNGGIIPANGSCTVTVDVTATVSGTYPNTIAAGNLATSGGTNPVAATDTLVVNNRPTIAKAFSPAVILANGTSTLTLTLSNNNPTAATGATFTDTMPTGVTLNGTPSTNCGGTLSSTSNSVTLTGGTIPGGAPGNCTVTVTVTAATPGSYPNTVAAGDLSTSNGTNAAPANATLTVNTTLTVTKLALPAIFDPVNNTTNPKAIPGGVVPYSIGIVNNNVVALDNNTVLITDPLPVATTDLCVAAPCTLGNPPFTFIQGTPTSTLTFTFTSLASATDDVEFSNNNGATYAYTPVANAAGVDPAVTHVRFNPKGSFAGNNASFQIRFLVRVQ